MVFCSACGTLCAREAKFCHNCGNQASGALEEGQEDSELDIYITEYFHRGYPYNVIVGFLEKHHGIRMHVRTLKRKLKRLDLKRREPKYDEDIVRELIKREIQGSGSLGYRSIWHALRLKYHVNVPRNLVASMMKEIDPDGVKERVARRLTRRNYVSTGPNFCWHIDGYDKLKPYGFPIHGCICGYSRRIIWLEVVKSNSNPKIIARLFLDAVQNANGCPRLVRSDCGTVLVAAIQSYFRANGDDEFAASKAHKYGSSPSNQRIEGWWSFFRRSNSNWWINFFKDMCESGILEHGNSFHMACLRFCFSRIIQKELDEVIEQWNSHYIRRSRHDTVAGVPDILYFLPENSDAVDCLIPVTQMQIQEVEPQCEMEMEEDVYNEYFDYIVERKGWHYPNTVSEAFDLYQCINQLQADD